LAQLRQKNEALKVRLEGSITVGRKRVVPDQNRLFVNIEQIHRAHLAIGRAEDSLAEESEPESPEAVEDCIVVDRLAAVFVVEDWGGGCAKLFWVRGT